MRNFDRLRSNFIVAVTSASLLLAACASPVEQAGTIFDLGSPDLLPARDLASSLDLRQSLADLLTSNDLSAPTDDLSAPTNDLSSPAGDLSSPAADLSTASPDLLPAGPVAVGTYQYELIQQYDLKDPPDVAWHPSGRYALVLNHTENVYRYDPKTKTIALAGTSGSTTFEWKGVAFLGTGDTAVLVGNETATGQAGGRVYVWEDATSTLSEATGARYAGGTYPALDLSTDRTKVAILGVTGASAPYTISVWDFEPTAGRTNLRTTTHNYTCTDLAFATDNFNNPAIAIACDSKLLQINGGNQFVPDSVFNAATPHVFGRAQGDYASPSAAHGSTASSAAPGPPPSPARPPSRSPSTAPSPPTARAPSSSAAAPPPTTSPSATSTSSATTSTPRPRSPTSPSPTSTRPPTTAPTASR